MLYLVIYLVGVILSLVLSMRVSRKYSKKHNITEKPDRLEVIMTICMCLLSWYGVCIILFAGLAGYNELSEEN